MHWNGGRDTVEPLLQYCKMHGYRSPDWDCYGWARMCQVLGNFFGGSLSVGITEYTTDEIMNPGDNGIYVIENWKIVDRIYPYDDFIEQNEYDPKEMLRDFDRAMPEGERLGDYLESIEIPTSDVKIGDWVYMRGYGGAVDGCFEVVGTGNGKVNGLDRSGIPYVKRSNDDTAPDQDSNNYIMSETCRIRPHK